MTTRKQSICLKIKKNEDEDNCIKQSFSKSNNNSIFMYNLNFWNETNKILKD